MHGHSRLVFAQCAKEAPLKHSVGNFNTLSGAFRRLSSCQHAQTRYASVQSPPIPAQLWTLLPDLHHLSSHCCASLFCWYSAVFGEVFEPRWHRERLNKRLICLMMSFIGDSWAMNYERTLEDFTIGAGRLSQLRGDRECSREVSQSTIAWTEDSRTSHWRRWSFHHARL